MSAVASSQNILCVFCYLLKTPAPPANWPLLRVFWRSQLLFINDEPWCWHTVGRAGGFLFLSAALSILQHSGRCSTGETEETGTRRQDPSCSLCWWEPLAGCLHWSVLFLQGLERTSGIKMPFQNRRQQTGWATLLIAQGVIGVLGFYIPPWALFYLHTSHSLWLLLPLLTISSNNFPVFF